MPRWERPRTCGNSSPIWRRSSMSGRRNASCSGKAASSWKTPRSAGSGVCFEALGARAVATLGHPIVGEMTTTAEEPEVTAYCAQVAEVEVDPDTGQVTVHRLVTAHDVGTIINPLDHQGQIDGAVMQGLGYALMEGLQADEGHITTLSLREAKIPTMQD